MDATTALITENEQAHEPQLAISVELIAYIALAVLTLVLHVAQLDSVPLTTGEARQALAAWRAVYPQAARTAIVPNSPLLFTLHSLMFTVLGATEFSARILTALAGLALIFTPLLFRDLFGRTRNLMCSVLLAFSPILLITSRTDSPVIWTLLDAIIGLWGLHRYRIGGEKRFAALATVCLAVMIFLTDPTGVFLALVLGGAAVFTFWTRPQGEVESESPFQPVKFLAAWPWLSGLLIALLVLVVISTQFLSYSAGLDAVGELLSDGVRGLVTPRPFIPAFFPVLVTLYYEPLVVILGIAAIVWLRREGLFSTSERFLTGWLIFATVFDLVYAGSGPELALWLIVPLAGLVSLLVAHLLTRAADTVWWSVPGWSKWLVAGAVIALLSMFAIHSQLLARTLMFSPQVPIQINSPNFVSVVWVVIIVLFMVIGYFLATSVWGVGTTTQGGVLGFLVFMLVTSVGSGWRAAVFNAANPVEFWNRNPTHYQVFLLRDTLTELSKRNSGGFPMISVAALAPDDGVVAWTLRNFPKTRFIPDVTAAKAQEMVLLPASIEHPDLGGAYVGERFTITSGWDYESLLSADLPAWWLQRRTRTGGVPADQMVLWLRQDIYDGIPFPVNQ
jgi:hypothetical protein